ncbi:fatty acid--CoA ligase family protein [Aldersonia sp. NBC_00410]|uniref:class I adenylate-forming enzyme family protein n=1 Tax=Aldersonia sp. NBC_00410 TaxID=2975954 RepID=UPI00225BADBE|nr:fatty acid--CoA ligase family protein [Aldersonia sp. NBC_00410]MCX5045388.1 fatty acid--CoA ligase family protein [Aldersonia sp. NBC_00410]
MHAGDDGTGFAEELTAHLTGYGDRPFIEFEHQWYSGTDIERYIDQVSGALDDAGVSGSAPVALVVRNRLPHAAAILGFIAQRRPLAMVYSYQSDSAIARDIEALRPAAVIADREDWTDPVVAASARIGSAGVALSLTVPNVESVMPRRERGHDHDPALSTAGLHILTSGTTGPPRRLPLRTAVLRHTVLSMTGGLAADPQDPPELVFWPFGSVGICQLLAAPFLGKRMVLLEKFTVQEWVRAVKTYRIRRTGVQPAILRMLLDADVAREDLASLESLPGGSGPLDPGLRAEFEQRYGIPLLWGYGATEFAGSVCAWTPALYDEFGAAKPGSVGRPLPGVEVRIIDPDTGSELRVGEQGFLAARVAVIGPEWIRTTDLGSMDADGFVTLHGRGDGAINRGGFKILPETVRSVLLGHPAVLDAAVVGVDDRRLGQVPFAAVELRHGMPTPGERELLDLVRAELPSQHVPVAIAVVDELPRNTAMKVLVRDVAALYEARSA